MSTLQRFEPPSIPQRGQIAQAAARVYERRPEHGETRGLMRCICGGSLSFVVQSNGLSRGQCSGCAIRWAL